MLDKQNADAANAGAPETVCRDNAVGSPAADYNTSFCGTIFRLSFFNNKRDTTPKPLTVTWEQLRQSLATPEVRLKKDGQLFSPASFSPPRRSNENVIEISMLVLDCDHSATLDGTVESLRKLRCASAVYSTHSHSRVTDSNPRGEPRFRVVVPLAAPIPAGSFPALWRSACLMTGLLADEQAKDLSRMFYLPARATVEAPYDYHVEEGDFFDWRGLDLSEGVPSEKSTAAGNARQDESATGTTFSSHEDRHAELIRRIIGRGKRNPRGHYDAPCIAHNGKGETSLAYFPNTDAVTCNAGCDYFAILRAEGLPDFRLPKRESDEEVLQRLAALPRLDYERQREDAAKALGCRTPILDRLVESKRTKKEQDQDGLQGRAVLFTNVEPWPESVNGADVLNELAETFARYVVLPNGAADALALWCAQTHSHDAFVCTPRLNITSPQKQCGKTTLRDVLAELVPRPLLTENLTVAVLFRMVEAHKPTLLADECDAWIRDNEELRGLLNAGHRRGGRVYRCEGEGNEVRAFDVFAPAVLCGIGALPGTLQDRSIEIRLERAKPGESRDRFDSRRTQREQELCRKVARFCADNRAAIEASDPKLPARAFNRLADNWRPLFAIAEVAGGDWPKRAADAFAKVTSKDDVDAQSIGIMLLADIQQVFSEAKTERIFSRVLVDKLCAMTDRPWPEARRGAEISEVWLARHLKDFGIKPKTLRIEPRRAKGYELADFSEAFERYLPQPRASCRDNVTSQQESASDEISTRDNEESCHGSRSYQSREKADLSRCHGSDPTKADEWFVVDI